MFTQKAKSVDAQEERALTTASQLLATGLIEEKDLAAVAEVARTFGIGVTSQMRRLIDGEYRKCMWSCYLHHGDLARGTSHFRTSIAEGQELMRTLRGHISGLCQATYVLDIPGGHGKVPIGPSYLTETEPGHFVICDHRNQSHDYNRLP